MNKIGKKQIIEVIKANQHLPYDEVKRQAEEAGLSPEQFEESWKTAKLDPSVDNDARVDEIITEMKTAGKESKTHAQWKEYLKNKGYYDDEVDLAYVLTDTKIKFNPLSTWCFAIIAVILTAWISICLIAGIYRISEILIHMFILLLVAILAYLFFLARQFRKITLNIINLDFHAEHVKELPEWKQKGSKIITYPKVKITNLFKMMYDDRETFYGECQYTRGSGRNKKTYNYSIIVQKAHKEMPPVHCFGMGMDMYLFNKKVRLEGNEFCKKYDVYAKNPTDAFYVLNPRVMSALLKKEVVKELRYFETIGGYILMLFEYTALYTSIRIKRPIVRFSDYDRIKLKMLRRLDLASDINDTLSRQIVDDGTKRSVAKHK